LSHRVFKDGRGRVWNVWEVVPTGLGDSTATDPSKQPATGRRSRPVLSGAFQAGWLAFQWDSERRRLAPVPEHWDALADDDLQRLLEQARPSGKVRRLIE